ncbi:IS4 family transposase, partial [Sandaracinobacter neustonicus]|uniref:IS4 family transposase n=1 Tax=Sandaracinobacter neustonicus TaxID=1715348 RepID=UPI0015E3ED4E
LKRRINPTRVQIAEKESYRWLENMRQSTTLLGDPERLVHIGDRENDIYEFFCETQALGTHFLVRTCVDRLAGDGGHTIADEMSETTVQGTHRITIGKDDHADIALRYRRIQVLPPIGKQKRYPSLSLTILHARESGTPEGRPPIDWRLITDLPVTTPDEAIEKLDWYAQRWKIELFHKILKSGCRAEDARLRTAERLANLIAIFCILSWRLFWMTMINRAAPDASPRLILTDVEITLIDHLAASRRNEPPGRTLSDYLTQIARLGGYLARAHDPPPGNIVIWRGWSRLMDIKIGANVSRNICG